jgi:hypothetical protein
MYIFLVNMIIFSILNILTHEHEMCLLMSALISLPPWLS